MLRHRLVPAIALLLTLGACGSDSDGASPTDGSSSLLPAVTVTTAPADTTAPPPETTVPAPEQPTGAASPREAAEALFAAWKAEDRAAAAAVADPEAVAGVWAAEPGEYALYNQCDSAEFDTSGCLFRGAPGTIQMTMERRGEAWVVLSAFFSPPGNG